MNLYAITTSEKGKSATKGGQETLDIEILNGERKRIAHMYVYFIAGHELPQMHVFYCASTLEQSPYIKDAEEIPY